MKPPQNPKGWVFQELLGLWATLANSSKPRRGSWDPQFIKVGPEVDIWGRGQSRGTELLSCGVWRHLQVDDVRVELSRRTPSWGHWGLGRPPHAWWPCVHSGAVRAAGLRRKGSPATAASPLPPPSAPGPHTHLLQVPRSFPLSLQFSLELHQFSCGAGVRLLQTFNLLFLD